MEGQQISQKKSKAEVEAEIAEFRKHFPPLPHMPIGLTESEETEWLQSVVDIKRAQWLLESLRITAKQRRGSLGA